MRTMKQLIDYFPIDQDGLFSAFQNPVWVVELPDSAELDTYFMLNYGERLGSKIVDYYADASDGTVKGDKLTALANMIYTLNSKKWEHLFKVYMVEYNPIENTDFVETINDTTVNNRTGNSTSNSSGSATTNGTGTNTGNNSGSGNVFGFNSAAAVGDTTTTGNNTDTTTTNSTTTSTGNNTDSSTSTDSGTHTSTHIKHGNIGITSNVELMTGEVNFWKWSFIDDICKDICNVIALSIF